MSDQNQTTGSSESAGMLKNYAVLAGFSIPCFAALWFAQIILNPKLDQLIEERFGAEGLPESPLLKIYNGITFIDRNFFIVVPLFALAIVLVELFSARWRNLRARLTLVVSLAVVVLTLLALLGTSITITALLSLEDHAYQRP